MPKNSVSSRLHEKKPYTAPQFKHLTLEQAKVKLLVSAARGGAGVTQLLEWISQLEIHQHEKK